MTDFKEKEVSLFHPNEALIGPGMSGKFQKKLKAILVDRLKCKLVLGRCYIMCTVGAIAGEHWNMCTVDEVISPGVI